jgi:hypothetical protein
MEWMGQNVYLPGANSFPQMQKTTALQSALRDRARPSGEVPHIPFPTSPLLYKDAKFHIMVLRPGL